MDHFMELEHILRMAKAKARQILARGCARCEAPGGSEFMAAIKVGSALRLASCRVDDTWHIDWRDLHPSTVRRALGCLIGEVPPAIVPS